MHPAWRTGYGHRSSAHAEGGWKASSLALDADLLAKAVVQDDLNHGHWFAGVATHRPCAPVDVGAAQLQAPLRHTGHGQRVDSGEIRVLSMIDECRQRGRGWRRGAPLCLCDTGVGRCTSVLWQVPPSERVHQLQPAAKLVKSRQ